MVDLPESGDWEETIDLLESGALSEGGVELSTVVGYSNVPHQQLANRTGYLKTELDDALLRVAELETTVDTLSSSLTAALETVTELGASVGSGWQTSLTTPGGTVQLPSLGQYGYRIAPDGFIEQWVMASSNSNGYASVTWPIAFPNFYYGCSASHIGTGVVQYCEILTQRSLTGTQIRMKTENNNVLPGWYVFVIGKGF